MQDALNESYQHHCYLFDDVSWHRGGGDESTHLTSTFSTCHLSLVVEEGRPEFTPLSSCWKELSEGPYSVLHFNMLFTPTLNFISAIWCIRMKELLRNACSDSSDETDVLGNYQKCVGQRKDGYQMTHEQAPAAPTESTCVLYVSVSRWLQFRYS